MRSHLPLTLLFAHFFVCSHAGSASIQKLLLRGNRTNSCRLRESLLDVAKCNQRLAELYFGQWVTLECPKIGMRIALWKCTGCPWDRLNHSVASYQNVFGNLYNADISKTQIHSLLFHPARRSCSIVLYLEKFHKLSIHISLIDLLAVLLPSLANILLLPLDASGATKTATVFAYTLSEPFHVTILLLCYVIGHGFAVMSRAYYDICDSWMASNSVGVSMVVNFVLILYLTIRRALKLRTPNVYIRLQSWALYRESRLEPSERKRLLLDFLCVGGPVTVLVLAFFERVVMPWLDDELSQFGSCIVGQVQDWVKDLWYYFESFVLFMTAVVVSFGPSRRKTLFLIRYLILSLIVVWVLLAFLMRYRYRFKLSSWGMTIPLVRRHDFDIGFAGITCTLVLAMLGLAEPLRVGWYRQGNPTITNNNVNEDDFLRLA